MPRLREFLASTQWPVLENKLLEKQGRLVELEQRVGHALELVHGERDRPGLAVEGQLAHHPRWHGHRRGHDRNHNGVPDRFEYRY